MEQFECYIKRGTERAGIFISNLAGTKTIGFTNIFFYGKYNHYLFRTSVRIGFNDLESFRDFWGDDSTDHFLQQHLLGSGGHNLFFVRRSGYEKYSGRKEIFLKYFTSYFWAQSIDLASQCDAKYFREEIIRMRECDELGIGICYNFLEECLERMMGFVAVYQERYCFNLLSEFRWYREVVGL
jgi:hypothetical protein